MKSLLTSLLLIGLLGLGLSSASRADEMMMARVNQDFPEAMLKLQEALKKQGYTISRVQRVDIGLTKSGYKTDKYRVVFYGKADEINRISQRYPELIPYLPLKIAIFAEANDTLLVAANPMILAPTASKELQKTLRVWERDLEKLLVTMKQASD
jgi:uncharacterized protein (DUF302 family)